jgi:hypothetical protein
MDFRGADLAMCGRLAAQNQWETSLYCLGIGLGKVLVEMVGVHVRLQDFFIGKVAILCDEQVESARMNASTPLVVLCLQQCSSNPSCFMKFRSKSKLHKLTEYEDSIFN